MPSPEVQGLPLDAFASAAVGMAVICPESGRYLRVNPALCRMLRRDEADLLGRTHESLTHTDDRAAFRERARALLAGEIDWWQVEKVIEAGDGEQLWVRSSGSLIHDREGRPFFFTQYHDISDRRRAEEALHHSDVRLHTAVAKAPLVLFTLDREGRVTFVEGGGMSSLVPPPPKPGESIFDVYSDQPEIERNVRRALAGETFATVVEVRGVAFDARYAPLYDDRGEVVGVVGTAVDATERVAAAREVESREARQSTIAELGRAALEGEDHDAVIERCAQAVTGCLGVEAGGVFELTDEGSRLALRAGAGWSPTPLGTELLRADQPVFEQLLRTAEPMVVEDLSESPELEGLEVLRERSHRGVALVCVTLPEGPAGMLVAASSEPKAFAATDIDFLKAVAHTIAASAARSRHEQEMRHRSLHDALTGLPNRTLLADRVEMALAEARRGDNQVALLLIDLDDFKDINDTLGHESGDEVLSRLAARLAAAVRDSDTVARLGGDEFAVVVPFLEDPEGAELVARKLLDVVDEPVEVGGSPLHLAASVGIAMASGQDRDTGTLLRQADVAMYQAKRAGGGVAFYDPERDVTSMRYLAAAAELRDGIARGELAVHYQPSLELATGAVRSVEALVRWQHPSHGLLAPDRFVPMAERAGLMAPLTRSVLRSALEQREHLARLGFDLGMAVNVSPRSLEDETATDLVSAALASTGGEGSRLELDITESAVVEDYERVAAAMGALRATGVRFALDHFGTGHSSLSQLERLHPQLVKIDRSFTARLDDPRTRGLVGSMIELLEKAGVTVVAQGVETEEQRVWLSELGCELAQGFHLARPMAAPELERWLAARGSP